MERTREQQGDSEPRSIGVGADMHRLRKDGSASVDELRDFVDDGWGSGPRMIIDYALLVISVSISRFINILGVRM